MQRTPRRSRYCLAILISAFFCVRLPAMFAQAGGQDEDYFAVPGWTILCDGVPRIPYVPSRDPQGVFYRADEALLALPPLYFYWQACVYAAFGPGYAQARIASALAGAVAIVFVFLLGRRFQLGEPAALWGAGLYSIARLFFFPATTARPDMLCAAVGLAALLALPLPTSPHAAARPVAAGLLLGLAGATHPFALVMVPLLSCMVLLAPPPSGRWRTLVLLSAGCGVGFAVWLPTILNHAELFRIQFGNNVLSRTGPGLLDRLTNPWDSLTSQARLFVELAGPWQTAVLVIGLAVSTARAIRGGPIALPALAWSSCLLLALFQEAHPTKGYWCFPGAFLFLCLGQTIASLVAKRTVSIAAGAIAVALMIPGGGWRATLTYLRHGRDADYFHPAAVERLLGELPPGGKYLVDVSNVLDFYLAGRDVTLALNIRPYFEAAGLPFDALVVGRTGLAQRLPEALGPTVLARSLGRRDDELAEYVEVHRPVPR